MTIKEYKRHYLNVINSQPIPDISEIHISKNTKTGISINLPIIGTCHPTTECHKYCYGLRGPIVAGRSLKKYHQNLALLNRLEKSSQSEVNRQARILAKKILKAKRNWIRWNGVGDLTKGSIRVINAMASMYPEITQWIPTRRFDLIPLIKDYPAIKLLLGTDASTKEKIQILKAENRRGEVKTVLMVTDALGHRFWVKKFSKLAVRKSFVRRTNAKVADGIAVIFNEHIGQKKFITSDDSRTCQATNGQKVVCENCRRCFK